MLNPDRWDSKDEVLKAFCASDDEFSVVLAMAKVGWAFCQIHVFENMVSGLTLAATKVKIGKPAQYEALDAGAQIILKHEKLNKTMLGQMVGHLKNAGFSQQHSEYMEKLVEIRNDFIHRFSHQVPLPGDWERYGYDAEHFATYPQSVGRRFERATHAFPKFMIKAGLLKGHRLKDGMLLFNEGLFGQNK